MLRKSKKGLSIMLVALLLVSMVAGFATGYAEGADEKIKLGWFFPVVHPFGETVKKGADLYAEEHPDIDCNIQFGTEFSFGAQEEAIQSMVAMGYKYIVTMPADGTGINGLADQLKSQDAHLGLFGAGASEPTSTEFLCATDVAYAASLALADLVERMGGKGNMILAVESMADTNNLKRIEAVETDLAEKYPDVTMIQKIVLNDASEATEAGATEKVDSAVAANVGKVDGILCVGYTCTLGMVNALKNYYSSGNEKKIYGVGIDIDDVIAQAIADGIIDSTLVQNSEAQGYIGMTVLEYMAKGYKIKEGAYNIDSGCVMADKDNLETYTAELDAVRDEILNSLLTTYMEQA